MIVTDLAIHLGFSLPLDLVNPPLLGRVGFEQKVIDKHPRVINDDVVSPDLTLFGAIHRQSDMLMADHL
jgi:hypothetical protein